MRNILLIGNPFHMLESELSACDINFEKKSLQEIEATEFSFKNYNAIVFIGVNVLLNTSKLDLIKRAYSDSSLQTKFFWWTHETFWDYRTSNVEYMFGRKTYIFNCYNGLVHTSPFAHYFGVGGILWSNRVKNIALPDISILQERFDRVKAKGKSVCAYATCFHDFRLDIPHSIVRLRNNTIKKFWDKGICDVYGKNWVGEWQLDVTEESRAGSDGKSWGRIKVEHSKENYLFSICIENSLIKNYATEKFAQAIESHLIPIYVFGNELENYFNINNAISIDETPESLTDAVKVVSEMTFDEYYMRLASLTKDYNKIISQVELVDLERTKPAKILARKITQEI